jgi:hypothetical protein
MLSFIHFFDFFNRFSTKKNLDLHADFDLVSRLCLVLCVCSLLTSCEKAIDVERLSTDVHVAIAQHTLALPFAALEDYAYRQQSFSFNRKSDSEHALNAADELLRDSADSKHPLTLDNLTIIVRTYGWNDADMRQRQMCPLLTSEWARSVCDNPWAAIQQALPADRFKLVDLSHLKLGDPHGPAQCIDNGKPLRPLPQKTGESAMVCEALVFGGDDDKFHHAVVRIDGELGALWTVGRHGQNGESEEGRTEREGKAIVAFVQYGLGSSENFPALHAIMCDLRRPNSADNPHGADCESAMLPTPTRNPNF